MLKVLEVAGVTAYWHLRYQAQKINIMCVCARACVRACVRVCVCACVCGQVVAEAEASFDLLIHSKATSGCQCVCVCVCARAFLLSCVP